MKKNVFCQITKVNAAKREVTGILTQQITDKTKEKMDYESSKPLFQKWSDTINKASGGKSLGNVREMHQPKAIGKFTDIIFDDVAKAIIVTAYVKDDVPWEKCQEGIYTGFSIGGNVVGKMWNDPEEDGVMCYTVDPVEGSIVDNPCGVTSHFTSVKMDGAEEQCVFKLWAPSVEAVQKAAVELAGDKPWTEFMDEAREKLVAEKAAESMGDPVVDDDPAEDAPEAKAEAAAKDAETVVTRAADIDPAAIDWGIVQVFRVTADGSVFATKAEAKKHVAAGQAIASSESPMRQALFDALAKAAGTVEKPADDVVFADPGLQADKKKRYPIDTPLNIRASWTRFCKAATDGAYMTDDAEVDPKTGARFTRYHEVADAIAKAWAEKIGGEPPEHNAMLAFTNKATVNAMADALEPLALTKSLWQVRELARILDDMSYVVSSTAWEEEWEHDTESMLPSQGAAILQAMGTYLVAMATEEVAELMADLAARNVPFPVMESGEGVMIELATMACDVIKGNEALMTKAGARNSKGDAAKIQSMHDNSVALGASCDTEKAAAAEVKKIADENADLRKLFEDALPEIKKLGDALATMATEKAALETRLKAIEDQPEPMPELRTVGKADDALRIAPTNGQPVDINTVIKGMDIDTLRKMAFDQAFANPQHLALRGGQGDNKGVL